MPRENQPTLKTPLPEFLTTDAFGYVQVSGSRIGLEILIRGYDHGDSPEMLALEYPSVSLANIHKVIAFYLDHRDDVDRYIAEDEAVMETRRAAASRGPSVEELRQRLAERQLAKQA